MYSLTKFDTIDQLITVDTLFQRKSSKTTRTNHESMFSTRISLSDNQPTNFLINRELFLWLIACKQFKFISECRLHCTIALQTPHGEIRGWLALTFVNLLLWSRVEQQLKLMICLARRNHVQVPLKREKKKTQKRSRLWGERETQHESLFRLLSQPASRKVV